MEHVRSAALNVLVPAGCVYDPPGQLGLGAMLEGCNEVTPESVRAHYRRHFRPAGTILSVAGNVQWEPLRDQVGRLFGDWHGEPVPGVKAGPSRAGFEHIAKEATQTQIG